MGPEPPALAVSNVTCIRGSKRIFTDLHFESHQGDLIELRGPNGAGKSSLLRLLAGLDEPAHGTIRIAHGFNYVGHLDAIKPVLTIIENLKVWADLMGDADPDGALDAFGLRALRDDPAMILSQGQKRRLALSRLALAPRTVWLLDEPTVGLDTASLKQFDQLITKHRATGGIVVAATHVGLGQPNTTVITLGEKP
jgi:heme exporter protein A